jgi:predicted Zn-dependent protease
MKAKIAAYEDPARASGTYDPRGQSFLDQYAWSIIDYRRSYFDSAVARLDGLLKKEPDNPYLYEFRGQILLEDGRFNEAQKSLQKALHLRGDAALIRILYAQSLIGGAGAAKSGQAKMLQQAIDELLRAKRDEPRSVSLHRMLATAYGRLNKTALAQLALAEEAVLLGRTQEARRFAEKAITIFEKDGKRGSGDWLKAQDILQYISNN